jgi:hypothetical protein
MPDPPLSLVEDDPLPSDLALEDTAALRNRGVAVGAKPADGYNPYDTSPPAGARPARDAPATPAPAPAPAKRTDLRKLSQWIQTQRRVEDLKKDGGDEDGK